MVIDLSDIIVLKSYCDDCIEDYDDLKQFNVSKKFRYLAEELEDLIKKDTMEHFPND